MSEERKENPQSDAPLEQFQTQPGDVFILINVRDEQVNVLTDNSKSPLEYAQLLLAGLNAMLIAAAQKPQQESRIIDPFAKFRARRGGFKMG